MSTPLYSEAEYLAVRTGVAIPRGELLVRATRASGPGGQHVNTSSTRIELLWNVLRTTALSDEMRTRLLAKLGKRVDSEGWLRVVASDSRSQLRNRKLAEERLAQLVRQATAVPKARRPTAPTSGSREERLRSKRRQAQRKRERRPVDPDAV